MAETNGLVALLPHPRDVVLLDHSEMAGDALLVSRQRIDPSHPVLALHFPEYPIWPGALLIEAMAQTTAVFLLHRRRGLAREEIPVLGAVETRFLQPARPGDVVTYETRLIRQIEGSGLFAVTARRQDGELLARGRISAAVKARAELPPPG